ncbi:MAG: hypothetical protein IKB38_09695 [Clostridia bacterium]|nr:hypothetical protein [Clostridia bacterium]
MKEKYLDIMEAALSAYSASDILSYYERVRKEGITEHGYPRLVANIGILIAKGRRKELLALFLDMMNLAAECMPKASGRGGNDFSVREIVSAIIELEKTDLVSRERTAKWRASLAKIVPVENYREIATPEREYVGNWAAYNAASEYMRCFAGIAEDTGFIDAQLESQLRNFDENGMYRDPNEPMLYDVATRVQLAGMLHFGYAGKHAERIEEMLDKSAELTEKMQSVTGELPFGGRSNQMLFNEAYLAAMMEYYAAKYKADPERASRFKGGAALATGRILRALSKDPLTQVKNCYPRESMFGCEGYAYFDKYMITLASFAYLAYAFADDDITPTKALTEEGGYTAVTSDKFHKFFINNGGYFLEFDMNADPCYDATGLGRIHKSGAPEALCLSVPFAKEPHYEIGEKNDTPLALSSTTQEGISYSVAEVGNVNSAIYAYMNVERDGKIIAAEKYTAAEDGINVIIDTEGDTEYNIPAYMFDGEIYTNTTLVENTLSVYYRGYVVKFSSPDAEIFDTGRTYRNRNGVYRLYKAHSTQRVSLHIEILKGSAIEI